MKRIKILIFMFAIFPSVVWATYVADDFTASISTTTPVVYGGDSIAVDFELQNNSGEDVEFGWGSGVLLDSYDITDNFMIDGEDCWDLNVCGINNWPGSDGFLGLMWVDRVLNAGDSLFLPMFSLEITENLIGNASLIIPAYELNFVIDKTHTGIAGEFTIYTNSLEINLIGTPVSAPSAFLLFVLASLVFFRRRMVKSSNYWVL